MCNPHGMTPPQRLPLVAAQPGIWMADKLSHYPANWSVAHFTEIKGTLDATLLTQAIIAGMSEADTLKLCYEEQDGVPWQWIDEQHRFCCPQIIDLRQQADPESSARRLMDEDRQQDLRLSHHQPLYHHCLMQLDDQRWFWYQRYHHLLVDGFSFTAITRRIAEIYSALCQGLLPPPSPFTPFSAVVDEYQRYQDSAARKRDADFWRQRVRQMPAGLTLSDQPLTSAEPDMMLHRQWLDVDRLSFATLNQRQHAQGLSGTDTLLALVSLWLGRVANQQDFSAGFIFMRRIGSAALCTSGPVLNVLPYEIHITPDMRFNQLTAALAEQMKLLRRHQRYDGEQVQRDSGINPQKQSLYSTIVNLKLFDFRLDFNGVLGITHQLASGPVRDLEITLYPDEQQQPGIELLARADRYCPQQLARHLQRINLLLKQLAANPELHCNEAAILHEDERRQLTAINSNNITLPASTLSEIIARQAQQTPQAMALADDMYQFTYQTMREQVMALARVLRKLGVQPGDIVAVALPRSVFLSLALQAIVETGAAWLPLDTGYPDARLHMMLTDARPRLLISSQQQLSRFAEVPDLAVYCYEACLPRVSQVALSLSAPEHTAYVIYTSGSTGRPKGVMISQQAIVNRLLWMQHQYPLQASDVVLQKTPCSFDVSVWEFFWPLMNGAQLVMAPADAHLDPRALQDLFVRWKVTTTHFVPSMLALFINSLTSPQHIACCQSLRQVFCSGEALPVALCRHWQSLTAVPLHNLYGPTEAAVDVSWYPAYGAALDAISGNSVPIGWPVWNSGLRILDNALQPLPPGVAGDLYLTGIQLAQGYISRPDLTASRFIADPFAPGERMYRTGDVARWLDNGAAEYLGRSDEQIKLRGQRIELQEIASALEKLPGVASAVVNPCLLNTIASGGDERQLVGYLIAKPGISPDTEILRQQLKAVLPAYMLPVALVVLDKFPLSANGKLDRKALPLPQLKHSALTDGIADRPPAPGTESIIASAFGQLLNCEVLSAQQDFFASGGHSLLAMRLAAELQRQLNCSVSAGQIMVNSTVAGLAQALTKQHDKSADNAGFETVLPLRTGNGPVLFCIHPASGFAWQFSVLQRYLDPQWSIIGIQSIPPDGPLQQAETFDQLVDHHLNTLRQLNRQRHWRLLGYSLGGTLAQAIAARLQALGEQVDFLGLLDTWPAESQNWSNKGQQLDPAVLAEIDREREAFVHAHQGQSSERLFSSVTANYADAVRLLATAHSSPFNGKATLFSAVRTAPDGLTPEQAWQNWITSPQVFTVDCTHVQIISPERFAITGPVINRLLNQSTGQFAGK